MMTTDELVAEAAQAHARSYAPYSKFHVGAAVVAGGHVFRGANVENASYGLCICAERNAVMAAVLAGERTIDACAVMSGSSPPAAPCGMCLQTLREFTRDPKAMKVTLANLAGERREHTLADLLPYGFAPEDLDR
jgi:cytidine deaminase